MAKVMVFVDGTWLYCNLPRLSDTYGKDEYRVDFGKLPQVLKRKVEEHINGACDLVRTSLFGSYATNYARSDEDLVSRRKNFFALLREEHNYQVEAFSVDFRGRPVRKADRDKDDQFEPREKCVDIALATSMLYHAAIPNAYDIAVAVIGDGDFAPVLKAIRSLGKRVCLASIHGSCSPMLIDEKNDSGVRDFDMLWLDEMLVDLELRYEQHYRECESPTHEGERKILTTFYPRKGQRFYCDACRKFYSEKRSAEKGEASPVGATLHGVVNKKMVDRGFGFIDAEDGWSYFFHVKDLMNGMSFDKVEEGAAVVFAVRKMAGEKAGGAENVQVV